jgi:hypothetical protein
MKTWMTLLMLQLFVVGCVAPAPVQPTYYQPPPVYYMANGQWVQVQPPPQVVVPAQQPPAMYYEPWWPCVGCLPLMWFFDPWFFGHHDGYYHGGRR